MCLNVILVSRNVSHPHINWAEIHNNIPRLNSILTLVFDLSLKSIFISIICITHKIYSKIDFQQL